LLGLFFGPENGGDMFLRNVGWLLTDYTTLYPRRQYFQSCLRQDSDPDCLAAPTTE
jgi:hypothetical protein